MEKVKSGIRKVIKNPFLNFFMGLALWFSSSAFSQLFWSDMMNSQMRAEHGIALLGAWRAIKYLPDVIDAIFKP